MDIIDLTSRQMTITSGENDDKQANTLEFRPKIISVTLRSHIGEPKELPFCIEPSQLVNMHCDQYVGQLFSEFQ